LGRSRFDARPYASSNPGRQPQQWSGCSQYDERQIFNDTLDPAVQGILHEVRADPGSWDSGTMSWPGQASEHEADHGETDEGRHGSRITLEIAGEPSVAADPSEGSLDNPSLGQDDETMQLIALDDLKCPGAGLGDGCGGLGSLVAGISEDALDEGKEAARASIEDKRRAVAILYIGGVDDDIQQEAERIDENMPFSARDLLARIKALRVERGAPF